MLLNLLLYRCRFIYLCVSKMDTKTLNSQCFHKYLLTGWILAIRQLDICKAECTLLCALSVNVIFALMGCSVDQFGSWCRSCIL